MNNKPLPTIGVDKYTFFKIEVDDERETAYGDPVSLRGVVEISPTDTGGADVFDADNGAYEATSYIEKIGHEITNADIPPEIDAQWRGITKNNGIVEVGGNLATVYFGVAWRALKSDGTYRYVRYYKGAFAFASNVGGKTRPSSGAPEKQTAKATFNAVQRNSDGLYYGYFDENDLPEGLTREEFEDNWFEDLTYYPRVN